MLTINNKRNTFRNEISNELCYTESNRVSIVKFEQAWDSSLCK